MIFSLIRGEGRVLQKEPSSEQNTILYLQIKKIFSKFPRNYAFVCVAIYLSMAAFLGLSGLAQARLPTIGSAFERLFKVNFIQNATDTVLQNKSQVSFDPEKMNPAQAGVVRFSMPAPADEIRMDHQSIVNIQLRRRLL